MNEPLFSSAHDALVFAFNYSGQRYGQTPMSKIAAPAAPGKGLSGVDGAAQAGFIRAEVAAIGRILEAILIARFAPHTVPCSCRRSCCIGKKPNGEWTGAIHLLADHLRDEVLKNCVTSWDMRIQYIMRQFLPKGSAATLDEIAQRNNRHVNTVSEHNAVVKRFFGGYQETVDGKKVRVPGAEEKARTGIEKRLTDIGMVQIDSAA